jgi:hypothetical protein
MRTTTALLLLLALAGCHTPTAKDLREKKEIRLKQAMLQKLYKDINNDSSTVKYEILSVSFFEGREYYNCEFKVHLKQPQLDTTGFMTADISKDMSVVKRKL